MARAIKGVFLPWYSKALTLGQAHAANEAGCAAEQMTK